MYVTDVFKHFIQKTKNTQEKSAQICKIISKHVKEKKSKKWNTPQNQLTKLCNLKLLQNNYVHRL